MNNKIGVIGHFANNMNLCDGQTVKTRNLAGLIEKNIKSSVRKVDTYLFKTGNKIRLFWDTMCCLFTCKHIFLMVSEKGMQFYLPFLYYVNKLTRRHIYHYIIGSELLELVKRNRRLVTYLNALDVNWFEYESGTRFLQEKGVTNVLTLANFKMITPVAEATSYDNRDGIYRFCTFSRVMEEKGITEAINAICEINESNRNIRVLLDIYGPVDPAYEEDFAVLLQKNHQYVEYKGIAGSTESVNILKHYYALLFPTHWAGEGCPGTVIDAFAAGIPIIASDWNANRELIQDGKQGIIYSNDKVRNLKEAIEWSIQHEGILNQMRIESRREFEKYTPESILSVILSKMKLYN